LWKYKKNCFEKTKNPFDFSFETFAFKDILIVSI
jgi:hypothetical protein